MKGLGGAELLVATSNAGKLEEIADLFAGMNIVLRSMTDFALSSPEETETTFAGNARIKALAAARSTGLPCLADDSGLEVDALGGDPGVRTADWAEIPGGRDFSLGMARVHEALLSAGARPPWTARFFCALVLAWPDGRFDVFEGRVEGEIVWPGRGSLGHGYDPIFQPEGVSVTFGEIDRWAKNRMSHRARAFESLLARFT